MDFTRPTSESPAAEATDEHTDPVPNYIVYRFFFQDVLSFERVSAELKSIGKNGDQWRTHIQREVGLTDEETKHLLQAASMYMQIFTDHDAKVRAMISSAQPLSPSEVRDKAFELQGELKASADVAVEHFRETVGEETFHKIDVYAKKNCKPRVILPITPQQRAGGAN